MSNVRPRIMARSLRPTLPIQDWRIAVHLGATQAIQNQPGTPAYKCECIWCQNWKRIAQKILPSDLNAQLQRFGIQPDHPTDLYVFEKSNESAYCSITYHVVGKLLSGPAAWRDDEKLGPILMYREVRSSPQYLSIVVLPHRQAHCPGPVFEDKSAGELVQIDLRLQVPIPEGVSN